MIEEPKQVGEMLIKFERWRLSHVALFLGIPEALIKNNDMPPPDDFIPKCQTTEEGYCLCEVHEQHHPDCEILPRWKRETIKVWAELRGFVFAPRIKQWWER